MHGNKVWKQDSTKFLHTAIKLRQAFEIIIILVLLMTPALYHCIIYSLHILSMLLPNPRKALYGSLTCAYVFNLTTSVFQDVLDRKEYNVSHTCGIYVAFINGW